MKRMTKIKESLETPITQKIIEALRAKGGFWFKSHGNMYQMAGLPDIIGCYQGRFVGIEVKRPSKKISGVSSIQAHRLKQIKAAGGIAGVASSVEDAMTILDENLS